MEDYFDPDRLAALLQGAVDWLLLNVANLWAVLQIAVLAVLFGLALLLSRRLRPPLEAWLDRAASPARRLPSRRGWPGTHRRSVT